MLFVAVAFGAGVLHALSFAPWNLPWLQIVALALLFAVALRSDSWREAALLGFAFGLGWFGVGVSWVYISMHVYGLMPAPLAAGATAAFCAFLSLYPALALAAAQIVVPAPLLRATLGLPATWCLSEWLRGTLLTGFPWLAAGYAHTDGPLAGFAPLVGVYGVTLVAALVAGALATLSLPIAVRGWRGYVWAAAIVCAALAGGGLLGQLRWTVPGRCCDQRQAGAGEHPAGPEVHRRRPGACLRCALGADAGAASRPGGVAGVGLSGAA